METLKKRKWIILVKPKALVSTSTIDKRRFHQNHIKQKISKYEFHQEIKGCPGSALYGLQLFVRQKNTGTITQAENYHHNVGAALNTNLQANTENETSYNQMCLKICGYYF